MRDEGEQRERETAGVYFFFCRRCAGSVLDIEEVG